MPGASDAEIAELERRSGGVRHPDAYRRFLALCGHDDDGLLDTLDGRLGKIRTVGRLLDLYEEDPDDWTDSGRPVVLGSEIGIYLAFDRLRGHGEGLRRVVGEAGLAARRRGPCACGLSCVLLVVHLAGGPGGGRSDRSREMLTAFAAEHGLTPAWFGDERHVCLAGPGTLLWAGLTHAVFMVVAGDDEALVRRLGDWLVTTVRARNLTRMN